MGTGSDPPPPRQPAVRADTPRFLHRYSPRGYTSDRHHAMHREPEAISAAAFDDMAARQARRAREDQILVWKVERARLEQALDRLYEQRFSHDVTKQLRGLQRQVDAIDRRLSA